MASCIYKLVLSFLGDLFVIIDLRIEKLAKEFIPMESSESWNTDTKAVQLEVAHNAVTMSTGTGL